MPPKPKKKRPTPRVSDRRIASDVFPARPRPNFPSNLPFDPPVMRAQGPRVPEAREPSTAARIRDALVHSRELPSLNALNALADMPMHVARDVANARDADEVIHALTGLKASMDPNSPAARPSDARGGRVEQGAMLALNAIPGLGVARTIAREEAAILKALRLADRYKKTAWPALREMSQRLPAREIPRFPGPAMAGPSEVDAMRAIDRALTEPVAGPPRVPPGSMLGTSLEGAAREGLEGGGFTLDRSGKPFSGSGYVVADPRYTVNLDPNDPNAIARFLERPDIQAELREPNRFLGGWRDPETGQVEINVSRSFDRRSDALRVGQQFKQKAIGVFRDGQYVDTHNIPVGKETLVGPALRMGGKTYSRPFPEAHVHVLGQAEQELYDRALPANVRSRPYYEALQKMNPADEGFMARDASGNSVYLTRAEAAEVHGKPLTRVERTRRAPNELHTFDVAPAVISPSRIRRLQDALLPDEARLLTKRTLPAFEAAGQALPDDEIFGAGALAGGAKLGWYANSARALSETFGPDAPRFAALLASLSPQRPVSENLRAALDLWDVWNHTGRPTDPKTITRLMHDVARRNEGGGELAARIPNSIRALTTDDPANLALSGPKVFNFHRNLIGDAQRVTLDTWMQRLGGVGDNKLARRVKDFGQPSPTYLAYSGRIRQTADYLSRATGREWTPAEVQETLWSWGKALTETAEPMMKGVHPGQLDLMGPLSNFSEAIPLVTPDRIRGVPDFATLMNEAPFTESIRGQGLPLPVPRSPLPPPMPQPDPLGLDFLAGNLQRANRRLGERGALGGKGKKPEHLVSAAPVGRRVYHGTKWSGFDIPTSSEDIAPHVGTAGQANEILRGSPWDAPGGLWNAPPTRVWNASPEYNRLFNQYRGEQFPIGSRIIPLTDYTQNPVRLPKDKGWGDPEMLAQQLHEAGALTPEEVVRFRKLGGGVESRYGDYDSIEEAHQGLRDLLLSKGYDSIEYPNRVEADAWVKGGFDRYGQQRYRRKLDFSRVILDPERHLRSAFEPYGPALPPPPPHADPMIPQMNEGNAALPMLGLTGGAALAPLTLWAYLKNR